MASSQQSDASSVFSGDRDFSSVTDSVTGHRQRRRRFGSALSGKPGLAKAQRDMVTQAVRQSSAQPLKPKLAPPPDYENFLIKYRTLLENDPARDVLFFPRDDIAQSSEPQKRRTIVPSVSEKELREAKSLLAQQSLKQYTSDWSLVHFSYSKYGGDYVPLSKQCPSDELGELIYEIDLLEEENEDEDSPDLGCSGDQEQRVLKEGYLYKGPDLSSDVSFVNFKTLKKRYCYLRQDLDGSYKLDFYKDKPKGSSAATMSGVKATVYLELFSDVCRSPKRGKLCFELKLTSPSEGSVSGSGSGKKQSLTPQVLLAAESESQLDEWVQILQGILEKLTKLAKKAKTEDTTSVASSHTSEVDSGREDTLETLKAPDYAKFCKESDEDLTLPRHMNRQNPFAVYSDLEPLLDNVDQTSIGDEKIKPLMEKFGIRFLIECKALTALLPVPAEGGKMASQVEPFFLTLFLFDARDGGRRLSENFYTDLNPQHLKKHLPQFESRHVNGVSGGRAGDGIAVVNSEANDFRSPGEPEIRGVNPSRLWSTDRKALFSVTHPHSDVYLIVRIDKVLQGPTAAGQELYCRPDPKTAAKFQKSVPQICARLGHYRMSFAWAAKPVFQQFIGGTESAKDTISLYRQEGDKFSDDDLVKWINELKKPEKVGGKLQTLAQASVTVHVDVSVKPETLPGCVTSSYLPVSPAKLLLSPKGGATTAAEETAADPDSASPIAVTGPTVFEMQPFPSLDVTVADIQPHVSYQNHIFVYPMMLKYDSQRHFSKARNICCWVEFRDSDSASAAALKCLYGRFGIDSGVFVHRMGTFVSHHQTTPQWYDEVKTSLPVHLHEKHHFLFTFVHVGVESTQKKRDDGKSGVVPPTSEAVVGYAWLPLMKSGRLCLEDDVWLQVASTLPEGYLGCESLGLGKGYTGPEVKWVDGGRPLFRVLSRLASTVLTRDPNLQTFFNCCQRLKDNGTLADAGTPDKAKMTEAQAKAARRFTAGDIADLADAETARANASASSSECRNGSVSLQELMKALFSVSIKCLIEFLPAILDQLFAVLASAKNEDIALSAIRALVHVVHESCKANKRDALKAYIKYIFKAPEGQSTTTIHEVLTKLATLLLRPSRTEPAATAIFMKNAWFFLDVIVKSMCQRLLSSGRIQMSRTERFSAEFQYKVDTFVETLTLYLCQKYKEMPDECRAANRSLAHFLRACLSLMDRGFVFGLIYFVCYKLDAMESKTLKQYKIDFLQIICQHEHFLPLNVPVLCGKEGSGPYRKNAEASDDQVSVITAVEAACAAPSNLSAPSTASRPNGSSASSNAAARCHPPSPQKRHTSLFQRLFSFGVGMLNTGLASSGITNLIGDLSNGGVGANGAPGSTALDLAHEFFLSDDYCSNHYLVGLLLRHIDYSICESRDLRKRLIVILRNLLAKHSYDDRCQGKVQARLAALYFPLIPLLMNHLNHLELRDVVNGATPTSTLAATAAAAQDGSRDSSSLNSYRNTLMGEQVSPADTIAIHHSSSERSVLAGSKRQMSLWDLPANSSPLSLPTSNRTMPPRQDSEGGSSLATLKAISMSSGYQADGHSGSTSPTPTATTVGEESGAHLFKTPVDRDSEYSEIDNKSVRTLTQHSAPGSAREKSPVSSAAGPATLPQMLSQTEPFLQYSRFDDNEIKDLLICAIYVLKNVNRDALGWFWQQCDRQGLMEFLRLLDLLLYHFKYQGKQRIMRLTSNKLRSSHRTVTLPSPKSGESTKRLSSFATQDQYCKPSKRDSTIVDSPYSVLQEAHLAQEVGLVVLDCLAAFVCTQKALMSASPRSDFLEKICDMYYCMLSRQSSSDLLRQVIASLKLLVRNYTAAFLDGVTNLCNDLCRKLLECCNSPISLVQADACNLLYLLMRMNYEHTGKKNFSRVHQQVIISLSQLLGDGMNLNNPTFNRALSILNGFASSAKQHARFANEVKEVVRRQRTVLMATSQLKEHSDDPDMLADLQKSLADSYAQSPRLRETWMQNLARLHVKRQHFAEAAHCFLHMAAVTAEVLKANGVLPKGADQFASVSDNVAAEETLERAATANDCQLQAESGEALGYDLDAFINRIIQCAELMSKADRFEAMGPLYRCITPILEQMRDYEALTDAYATLHDAYEKATRVNRTGKRLLGTYFRVRFYSQVYFEHEHGKDYIYREPKYTPLAEFTERLSQQYAVKLGGSDLVRLISDSSPVSVASLDPKLAYIQVTHVEPYHFESQPDLDDPTTRLSSFASIGDYERHTNVRKFFYDCPFTSDGRLARAASVVDQCKRRIVVETTPKSFPYVVRRLPVTAERTQQMSPLETAIDELKTKSNELRLILDRTPIDCKRLQLRLQGAIQPTVNAGPVAYAEAFCSPSEMEKYGAAEIGRLCGTYREFLTVCWEALEINDRLITPDQFEYQQSLLRYFRDTVERLNAIFGSQMLQLSNAHAPQSGGDSSISGDYRRASERRHSGKRASAVFFE